MSEELVLIVAGYQELDSAKGDFVRLSDAVAGKTLASEAMLLLGKDSKGELMVQDTGDRLGRRGASWGAGVGALAGLVLPPAFIASTVAGTAVGGLAVRAVKAGVQV